jgi:hypothetical protein
MKWITRERVKVDRVACPWLIRKFVGKDAEFFFVPADKVMDEAKRLERIETLQTERGAHTLGFDAERNKVYSFLPETHRTAVYIDKV